MPKLFTILECTAVGVSMEASLNGFPLCRLFPPVSTREAIPVNQFLLPGPNELSVVVSLGPSPSRAAAAHGEVKPLIPASVDVRLTTYPEGVFPGDPSGTVMATLRWSGEANRAFTTPQTVDRRFDLPTTDRPHWTWESAPALTPDDNLRLRLVRQLDELAKSLQAGSPDLFLRLAEERFRETAGAFGVPLEAARGEWTDDLRTHASSPDWKVVMPSTLDADFVFCARGRVVECVAKDWLPLLRANVDAKGEPAVRYPIFVSVMGNGIQIVR